ncbi:MAG TPA: biotin transporter BioY, partial [Herbaspirillum sp.]|nr:biotin transporter BioY [Herbaspirillum sp.]
WLLSAPICSLCLRLCLRHLPNADSKALLAAVFVSSLIGGMVVMYPFGILGLMLAAHLSVTQAALAVLTFIPGDLVKCAICAVLVQSVMRGMPGWRLGRD